MAFAQQLRVVSLNASNTGSTTSGPRPGMDLILQTIGSSLSDDPLLPGNSGITRPFDILALQESRSSATTAASYAALLNQIYSTDRYAAGTLDGATTGAGTQVVVYNSQTLELRSMAAIGTTSITGAPRQPLRYQFRPRGYIGSEGDLFIYNLHLKAGGTATDESRRLVEANAVRADADALGPNRNVIYLGDFNVQNSADDSYQRFLSPGPAAGFDPINSPGDWRDDPTFQPIHTQSPWDSSLAAATGFNGTAGGVDDRYDFQLISSAITTTAAGLSYANNSYHAFGNNGSHAINQPINTGTAAAPAVLNALAGILDHLPIVADYSRAPRPGLAHPGDADLSLTTNITDFAILAANFNQPQTNWFHGDFNASGVTDISDFSILAANFNTTAPIGRAAPEPFIGTPGLLVALSGRSRRTCDR